MFLLLGLTWKEANSMNFNFVFFIKKNATKGIIIGKKKLTCVHDTEKL
jgi:hypothetical protein